MEIMEPEPNTSHSFTTQRTTTTIHCCICGVLYNPGETGTNICLKCITSNTDVTMGLTKQGILNHCRMCKRYLRPPWITCERESKELLSLCLKKIKGLNKVKLLDASFIWTEPHSKRIKLKLTVQKEVMNNASIQESFIVEFIEHYQQCEDCKKEFTPHTWGALVQVRQKVSHKKTFFYLEQMILKHNVHDKCLKIQEADEGIDFFFKNRTHANRLIDFLQSMIATKIKTSKQLISQDDNSNTYYYKYVYSVEIPKVCKEDLVLIPNKLRQSLGGVSPMLLCNKVSTFVQFIDPVTSKIIDVNSIVYFQHEQDMHFVPLRQNATEFMVVNIEEPAVKKKDEINTSVSTVNTSFSGVSKRSQLIEIARTADWKNFVVRSQMADILNCGNSVLGFDLTTLNLMDENFDLKNFPEVIIAKKVYEKKDKNRIWKLKRMDIEGGDMNLKKKEGKDPREKQFEEFMEDVEFEPEMRAHMNLYRDEDAIKNLKDQKKKQGEKPKEHVAGKRGKGKRVVKVKNTEGENEKIPKEEESKKDEKEDKPKETIPEPVHEANDDNDDKDMKLKQVRLEELMADLKLEDAEDNNELHENVDVVDDFIKRIEKVKIDMD